jgi:hypothetical protein
MRSHLEYTRRSANHSMSPPDDDGVDEYANDLDRRN